MLLHEIRHAMRSLRSRPAFTAVAILTLALGIGANAVIFSWIEATLLSPIPGATDQSSIAVLHATTPTRNDLNLSYPNYVDIRDAGITGVADVAVFAVGTANLRTELGSERVWAEIMSGNLFQLLGVKAAAGRLLTPDDDRVPDGHPVVVISHGFWQRRFGGRPDVVGSTLTLNGRAFAVVGISGEGFRGTQSLAGLDVFIPMAMQRAFIAGDRLTARSSGWLQSLVRLHDGISVAEAQPGFDVEAGRLAAIDAEVNGGRGLRLYELWRQPSGGASMMRPLMGVLAGLVATLLALVCANMASLFLARASGRQRELAVRRSLGANRGQVVRLLVVESLVLAVAAGAVACLVANWSGALLDAFIPPLPLPVAIDAGLNLRVLLFAALTSLVAGIVLGVFPGVQASKIDVITPLKEGTSMGGTSAWRRGRLRQGLIVAQVALALILLVSAGLFIRTLDAARRIDVGFHTRQGLVGAVDLLAAGYDEPRGRQFLKRIVEEVETLPGVEGAAFGQRLPLTITDSSDRTVEIEGYTPGKGEEMSVYWSTIGHGYFDVLRLPLVEGRDFNEHDGAEAPMAVIVNETMARRYWPRGSSLGGRVRIGDQWASVIGVAKDSKYQRVNEEPRAFMYVSVDQLYRPTMRLIVRTAGPPDAVAPALRQSLQRLDPNMPLFDVQTIEQHLAFSFFLFEMVATLLAMFGGTAMLLAALGLYGVVSYSVSQRTREIGVRVSLGASAGEVRRMVIRQGLILAGVGVALGLAGALATTRLFASMLVGVNAFDPASYGLTALLLVGTTTIACYVPARRAARLDPVQALRME